MMETKQTLKYLKSFLKDSTTKKDPKKAYLITLKEAEALTVVIELLEDCI